MNPKTHDARGHGNRRKWYKHHDRDRIDTLLKQGLREHIQTVLESSLYSGGQHNTAL